MMRGSPRDRRASAIQATLHAPLVNGPPSATNRPTAYFPISPWAGLAVLAAYTAGRPGAASKMAPPQSEDGLKLRAVPFNENI